MSGKAPRRRTRRPVADEQADLFSVDPSGYVPERLASREWPPSERFPVNHAGAQVRSVLWRDLTSSPCPVLIAGFSSIAQLVDLIGAWDEEEHAAQARVLLGSEPFASSRASFASAEAAFTDEVRRFWLEEQGISLRLSAQVVRVMAALDEGRLAVRFVNGLHGKVYVGSQAATVGSSNFTGAGLGQQVEVNARFDRRQDERRYGELAQIAENLWSIGQPWDEQFRDLLASLLRFVPWQEALARACSDLLGGAWANRYMADEPVDVRLWPSQVSGIAQALWIVENVGSVLVADATGSGKTRMGAHLVRAVRDRLWSTGRVRRDLTVLVCPPSVEGTWKQEAVACGLSINTVSHGLLSRASLYGPRPEELAVKQAQILAVDECHNFLTRTANRTRQVRDSLADHVALFTATPINRGPTDLLQLVGLLGPDNFEDETLDILEQLERRPGHAVELSLGHQQLLRREIQRFTVRRTKAMLNDLVNGDPEAYRHPQTDQICRYPRHEARTYDTGETDDDEQIAARIRAQTTNLTGIAMLGRQLAVPVVLSHEYSDQRWLDTRLAAARGLAIHHVLGAMRSSRAALVEHLAGTEEAVRQSGIPLAFKPKPTGNMLHNIAKLAIEGPPDAQLSCQVPDWLNDTEAWRRACAREAEVYDAIVTAARELSDARERSKANLLSKLSRQHPRVIAFDRNLITLAVIEPLTEAAADTPVITATGSNQKRKDVERSFAADSDTAAIALCSDALNEGLNLQGASAIVHLDLPTTLRVAEQRVGRVDRMDSPHETIEAWWPCDSEAFATRANELLTARSHESGALLGSNLKMPDLAVANAAPINIDEHIAALNTPHDETWDGIHDAFDPVRRLVTGPDALIPSSAYREHQHTQHRVLARVSPVRSRTPWAFFAITGTTHGSPRWLLLEGAEQPIRELDSIVARLRQHLADDPPSLAYDATCEEWLNRYLTAAARQERQLLPRRMQRALEQMSAITEHWATMAHRTGSPETGNRWKAIAAIAAPSTDDVHPDPYRVAEQWLTLVQPVLDKARQTNKRSRYVRLRNIDRALRDHPLAIDPAQQLFSELALSPPLETRVTACILGVPNSAAPVQLPDQTPGFKVTRAHPVR